jgi:hypothetical protein
MKYIASHAKKKFRVELGKNETFII